MRRFQSLLWVLPLLLVACGGGGGDSTSGAAAPGSGNIAVATRIEVAPNTLLLTAPGQQKRLVATVFDALGNPMQANVQWTSSRPGEVAVDAAGVATATGTGGSAQITAQVGAVTSQPLLAVHTQVPEGAVLLSDANILGQPAETTPNAAPSLDNTYQVRLSGVAAPRVGDLVLNTEGKAVAGRVRAVSSFNGEHLVTLGLVSAREMFPRLVLDERFDLNQAEVALPAELLVTYDIVRSGNTFSFTPKPGFVPTASVRSREHNNAASGTSALPPFTECKLAFDGASGAGSLPVVLSKAPTFSVTLDNRLDVVYTASQGLQRFVIHGEPSFSLDAGLKALVAFEGKVGCEVELLTLRIPVGGPLAFVIGGLVPIGVGVELGGKLTLASMALSAKASAKTTVDVGIACPGGSNCAPVNSFGPLETAFTPTLDAPGLQDLRIEPSLAVYGFAKASIGNPLFTSLRFNALSVKVGAAFKGNFAPRGTQIADAAYKSDYKLVTELKAGADTDFKGLVALLGLNGVAENQLELSADLGSSPTGVVTADKDQFLTDDTLNFTVKLDPGKVDFVAGLGPYNVQRVVLVRANDVLNPQAVASVVATSGQTEFNIPFTAPNSGRASEFYAFLVTTLVPLDLLSLEAGQAGTDTVSTQNTRLAAGADHTCAITSTGGVACWGYNGQLQLGDGSNTDSTSPVAVTGLGSGVAAITAGDRYNCALTTAADVKCWGENTFGNLGIAPGYFVGTPVDVSGLGGGVRAVSAGGSHTCAITRTGGVKCWGANHLGQLGNGSTTNSHEPVDVTGLTSGVVSVSAGQFHTCAITSTGALKCWGYNLLGALGDGTTNNSLVPRDVPGLGSGVIAVSSGNNFTCALRSTGRVQCWGYNNFGQLGNASLVGSLLPQNVSGLASGVVAISADIDHACALTSGGVKCWGYNVDGRLGSGNTIGSEVPVDVLDLNTGVTAIEAGGGHTCARKSNNAVVCWGFNRFGNLGNSGILDVVVTSPVPVLHLP